MLKIGVVASSQKQFDEFVSKCCYPNNENYVYTLISDFSSTNSLNLDLLLLADMSMSKLLHDCRPIVR